MTEIKTISTRVVYQNKWMTVREDTIQRTSGEMGLYGIVEKPDFAVVLAVENEYIYFVEQFRYTVGKRTIELPQGAWDGEGEKSMLEVAHLELQEETGLLAKNMSFLAEEYVAYGYSSQKYHIFLATDLEMTESCPEEEEEGLTSGRMKIVEFEERIRNGEIQDSSSITAFLFARLRKMI